MNILIRTLIKAGALIGAGFATMLALGKIEPSPEEYEHGNVKHVRPSDTGYPAPFFEQTVVCTYCDRIYSGRDVTTFEPCPVCGSVTMKIGKLGRWIGDRWEFKR